MCGYKLQVLQSTITFCTCFTGNVVPTVYIQKEILMYYYLHDV